MLNTTIKNIRWLSERRAAGRKANIEKKIALAIAGRDKARAIYLADKYHIPPQNFALLVIKYTSSSDVKTGR